MNQNFPEDELGGPETSAPASDVRFRYAVASPPNPWDQSPKGQAMGSQGGASRSLALLILLLGVIILATAVLYGKFIGFSGPAEDLMAGGVGETQVAQPPVQASPPSSSAAPAPSVSPSTIVSESRVSTPTSTSSPTPSTTVATTAAVTSEPAPPATVQAKGTPVSATAASVVVFEAPSSAKQCAANVNWRIFQANGATSCPFAENVAIAMKPKAGTTTAHQVGATSPVTGESYQMDCRPVGQGSFICEGGEGATVVLEHRHDLRPGPQD